MYNLKSECFKNSQLCYFKSSNSDNFHENDSCYLRVCFNRYELEHNYEHEHEHKFNHKYKLLHNLSYTKRYAFELLGEFLMLSFFSVQLKPKRATLALFKIFISYFPTSNHLDRTTFLPSIVCYFNTTVIEFG